MDPWRRTVFGQRFPSLKDTLKKPRQFMMIIKIGADYERLSGGRLTSSTGHKSCTLGIFLYGYLPSLYTKIKGYKRDMDITGYAELILTLTHLSTTNLSPAAAGPRSGAGVSVVACSVYRALVFRHDIWHDMTDSTSEFSTRDERETTGTAQTLESTNLSFFEASWPWHGSY